MTKINSVLVTCLFFFLFGLLFASIGFFTARSTRTFLKTAVSRDGVVISLSAGGSSGSTVYYPVVQFEFEGDVIEFCSQSGSSPASFDVDEKVNVLFKAEDPHDAKIDSFFSLWGLPLIFGLLGGLMMIVAIVIIGFNIFGGKKRFHSRSI